jgi:hypothetical protein
MNRNGTYRVARRAGATPTDILEELHRLHEAMMVLVLRAERAGLAIPRSCCAHRGGAACLNCSANWVAARVRTAERTA